jgi:hypothetical protein
VQVDLLLAKWEVLSAQMERAVMTRDRTGQDPMKRDRCCCGRQISVIADLNVSATCILHEPYDHSLLYWHACARVQDAAVSGPNLPS